LESEVAKFDEKALNCSILVHLFSLNGLTVFMRNCSDNNLLVKSAIDLHRLTSKKSNSRECYAVCRLSRNRRLLSAAKISATKQLLRQTRRSSTQSECDAMLPHADMRKCADAASRAGASILARFWAGSGLIRLNRDHSAECRDSARAFAEVCLLNKSTIL
jgi:hypothetical protein